MTTVQEYGIKLKRTGNMDIGTMQQVLEHWQESKIDIVSRTPNIVAEPVEYDYYPNYDTDKPIHATGIGLRVTNVRTNDPLIERKLSSPLPLTGTATRQISQKLDIPFKYVQKCTRGGKLALVAENFNQWLSDTEDKNVLVRTLDMGGVQTLYGYLSNRYRRIDCPDVFFRTLKEFDQINETKNCNVSVDVCSLTIDRMYIRASIPNMEQEIRENDAVIPAIIVSNSQSGVGRFQVEPMLVQLKCTNGLIGDDILSRIHIGKKLDLEGILSDNTIQLQNKEIMSMIGDYIRASFNDDVFDKWVGRFRNSTEVELEEPSRQIDNLVTRYDIPQSEKDSLVNKFMKKNDSTQFGLVTTLTEYARDQPIMDKRVALERVAGKLVKMEGEKFNKHLLITPRKNATVLVN